MSVSAPPITRYERLQRLARRFPQLDATAIESCVALLRLSNELAGAYEARMSRHGLSSGRFTVLIRLFSSLESEGDQGLTPAELAENSCVSRATMTGLLDTLEKDGLISRQDHPEDRRMYTVHLTPKAQRLLEDLLPEHFSRVATLMSDLDETERTTLRELLTKVSGRLPSFLEP
ncbi:MarR family transcriptional regulator [Myxococcus sp. K15C18031901]|uniref:MarR family winged helix-turn-helix transcriptional regulator n=1 Tax=Myxococcus dinghuensis TaxID=2906761 RepID=UPI0020A7A224|nr:MarR family transcriptional regulator [Myxococcus dinghuensis]MCP3104464.1 MarR family transcriptional regulator [Myxococcus dinghuensis]